VGTGESGKRILPQQGGESSKVMVSGGLWGPLGGGGGAEVDRQPWESVGKNVGPGTESTAHGLKKGGGPAKRERRKTGGS